MENGMHVAITYLNL